MAYVDFNQKAVEIFKLILKYAKEKNTTNSPLLLINKLLWLLQQGPEELHEEFYLQIIK